jgi:positive regulator of sigma E activity
MATMAAVDAGYPSPDSSNPTVSTSTIIAASVGSTICVVVLVGVITFFILRHRKRQQLQQRQQSVQLIELMQPTGSAHF